MEKTNTTSESGYVLIVDDNQANLISLAALLKEEEFEVRTVQDGPTALSMIAAKRPDLILLDIKMPGMDGYQVCREIKANERTASIPVIFLSALDDLESKTKGFLEGGVDYITKPFQAEEVLARVKTHNQVHNLLMELEKKNKQLEEAIMIQKRAESALELIHKKIENKVEEIVSQLEGENKILRDKILELKLREKSN